VSRARGPPRYVIVPFRQGASQHRDGSATVRKAGEPAGDGEAGWFPFLTVGAGEGREAWEATEARLVLLSDFCLGLQRIAQGEQGGHLMHDRVGTVRPLPAGATEVVAGGRGRGGKPHPRPGVDTGCRFGMTSVATRR